MTMPKVTRRTANTSSWQDPRRKDPGHDLNAPRATQPKQKNKALWCKGKVGRTHNYVYGPLTNHQGLSAYTCTGCGRQVWRLPKGQAC